ncbi:DNA-binding response regulator [Lysobacter sp. TY2-98]|uniref:response regulator transcription factor n=1 Tax=Lysobacter sp. TY2-98 TaxID=2290922 RepID=UPI000E1FDE7D|nr:response regulator transcription factor [Lysobacter sp. TY2-98]AXK71188.1 DNA-binding response regulator [Lysobacter sp. TY2-98]
MASTPFPTAAGLRVLLVEDQHDIAANIWDFLERRGYKVDHRADGASGLQRAMHDDFDVIVLDLGLPRMDGLELCRRLREAGRGTPILMLTARDTLEDKLRGFAEGADDYMVKPFELRELEARLRALHRARHPRLGGPLLECGPLAYDPSEMVALREERRIPLTRLQGLLLSVLLEDAPKISTHTRLLQAAWPNGDGDVAALHTQIYELRGLIDRPFSTQLLQSIRGIGYRICCP